MSRFAIAAALAMVAFASNSILCRMALRGTAIDPASFTSVRLVTGALTLWLLVRVGRGGLAWAGDWGSALALLVYAVTFSFSYVGLTAGTGALLLFGAVQLIMIASGLIAGERVTVPLGVGWALAAAGVAILIFPGISAPPARDAGLMICAGFAWGVYSLRGRRSKDALRDTAGNFVRAAPGALLVSALWWAHRSWDTEGIILAALSGAIASGLGYAAWYTALPRLSAIAAGNAQLSVPVIAAFGGVLLFGEAITARLAIASVLVLGGIALALRK
ncbi:MAG TPA: DMT family transporter [Steroidobacteraceae bacterium]|nr:DMT family transporter [Steroidobacteraceae bacterium]